MESKRKLIKLSIRVDEQTLKDLDKILGLGGDYSKIIRACMYFTKNVALNLFGGNLLNMFRRKKENEEVALYDQNL